MIFVRYLPWKFWVPAFPILTFLVVVVPTPAIVLVEGVKRLWRGAQRKRCLRILQQKGPLVLYTRRLDSVDTLEQDVLPALAVGTVAVEGYGIAAKDYRSLRVLLPRTLGAQFPVLLSVSDGEIIRTPLHAAVYAAPLQPRPSEEIIQRIQAIVDSVKHK